MTPPPDWPRALYNGTAGTTGGPLTRLLNTLGIGKWEYIDYGQNGAAEAVIDSANVFQLTTCPIILGVDWDGGHGGHWVMVDDVINLFGHAYACVNDPWDADVHVMRIKKGQPIVYEAKSPRFSFDLWGKHGTYSGGKGVVAGDLIRCTGMDVKSRLGKVFLSGNPL
jgi:hypothetical protein